MYENKYFGINKRITKNNNYERLTKNYIQSNPIKTIISTLTSIGFLILVTYYYKINYYPPTKIDDLPTLFLMVGLIGLIFVLVIIGALILPPFSFQEDKEKYLYDITYHNNKKIDTILKIKTYLIPLFLFLIFGSIYLEIYFSNKLSIYYKENWSSIIIYTYITLSLTYLIYLYYDNKKFTLKRLWIYYIKISVSLFFISISSVFILSMILLNNHEISKDSTLFFILLIGYIMFFNLINLVTFKYVEKLIINIILLVALFINTSTTHVISFAVMKTFGLGQIKVASIYIKDKKYCDNIDICYDNKIKDTTLLWKLGKEFVIIKNRSDGKIKRYFIDNEQVQLIETVVNNK